MIELILTLATPVARVPTAKSRVISVRLISMAMTGFFYQFSRPRTSPPMSMLKYDPVGTYSYSRISKMAKGDLDFRNAMVGGGQYAVWLWL